MYYFVKQYQKNIFLKSPNSCAGRLGNFLPEQLSHFKNFGQVYLENIPAEKIVTFLNKLVQTFSNVKVVPEENFPAFRHSCLEI